MSLLDTMKGLRRDRFERLKLLFMMRRSVLKDADRTPEWEYAMIGAMAMACYTTDLAEGELIIPWLGVRIPLAALNRTGKTFKETTMTKLNKYRAYHVLAYLPIVLCAPAIAKFQCSVLWTIPAMVCFLVGITMRDKNLKTA